MAKREIIATLELGSGKVIGAIGARQEQSLRILGVNEVYSKGLQNGSVISIEELATSIQQCIEPLETKTNARVGALYLGVKGEHVETYNHKGAMNISRTDKEITEEDLEQVLESARQMRIANDREIIETISQGYTVDKQKGVPSPIGMEATHLGVNVHLVTALSIGLNNVYKCVNRAGFKIDGVAYSVLAVGEVVVMPEEKDLGVALVDLGAHVTDIAMYTSGNVCYTKEISVGGEYITRDLAYGLRTSLVRARELKEQYGAAYSKQSNDDTTLTYLGVDGMTERSTNVSELCEIIHPRIEEILKMIRHEIDMSEYRSMVPAGVVLTGGTAKLKGIRDVAEAILEMPVRIGHPQGIEGETETAMDPRYATVFGLMKYVTRGETRSLLKKKQGIFTKCKTMLEEMF